MLSNPRRSERYRAAAERGVDLEARWIWRTVAAALLIALLSWLANVALWADRNLVDEAAFTATVSEVLVSDPARAEIAESIVDEAIDQVPLLALVKLPLIGVVDSILASELMAGAVDVTAQQVYSIVVRGEPAPLVISLLEIKNTLLVVVEGLAPSLIELIPDSFFKAFEVLEEGALPAYSNVRMAPWLWPIVVLLAIGLAVALVVFSPRRPIALIAIGVGLALGALLSFVSSRVAERSVLDDLDSELVRNLGQLAYQAFHASLVRQTLVMLGVGLLVMLAGTVWLAIQTGWSGSEPQET